MSTLYELIIKVKNDDQYAVEDLLKKYEPLMKKCISEAGIPTMEQKEEIFYTLLIRTWRATKLFRIEKVDHIDNIEAVFFKFIEKVINNQISNMKHHFGKVVEKQSGTLSLDYEYGEDEDKDMYERLRVGDGSKFDQELIDNGYIRTVISRLDDETQKIIYLYYFERYTDESIGRIFNLTRNAIFLRRKKALKRMKNLIIHDRKKQTEINNKLKKKELNKPKKPILMTL